MWWFFWNLPKSKLLKYHLFKSILGVYLENPLWGSPQMRPGRDYDYWQSFIASLLLCKRNIKRECGHVLTYGWFFVDFLDFVRSPCYLSKKAGAGQDMFLFQLFTDSPFFSMIDWFYNQPNRIVLSGWGKFRWHVLIEPNSFFINI